MPMHSELRARPLLLTAVLLLAVVASTIGCRSPQAVKSDSLAAVAIKGHSTMEIVRALSETFQAAGYQPIPLKPNKDDLKMQFERPGSTGSSVVYGDWSLKRVWYRAKLKIAQPSDDTHIVTCDAYRVNEHGDAHFEEERRLSGVKHGAYQKLLDAARARVESSPTAHEP